MYEMDCLPEEFITQRAVSNDTKLNVISYGLTKLRHEVDVSESATYGITLSNLVLSR